MLCLRTLCFLKNLFNINTLYSDSNLIYIILKINQYLYQLQSYSIIEINSIIRRYYFNLLLNFLDIIMPKV